MTTNSVFSEPLDLSSLLASMPELTKRPRKSAPKKEGAAVNKLKSQAKILRKNLSAEHTLDLTHSQSLELVARSHGFTDFNHASAHFEDEGQTAYESPQPFDVSPQVDASDSSAKKQEFIPSAVRALLESKWRDKTGETKRVAALEDDRASRPSFYHIHKGEPVDDSFTYEEARALAKEGAFGEGARERAFGEGASACGYHVTINEHAKHSLEEFLGEVSLAWVRHKERLNELVGPLPL